MCWAYERRVSSGFGLPVQAYMAIYFSLSLRRDELRMQCNQEKVIEEGSCLVVMDS